MKTRIITASVGILIFIAAIFASVNISTLIMHVLLTAVGCVGVYEAFKPTGYVKSKFILISSLCYAAITPFVYSIELVAHELEIELLIRHEVCLVLYGLVIFIGGMVKHSEVKPTEVTFAFATTVSLTFCFWSLAAVFSANDGHGLFYLILIFVAAWGCDTGAYFTGYFFGKHKLAPNISPKKTVEGAVGGVIFDCIVMVAACIIFNCATKYTANILLIGIATPILALASMFGDLIFSYIKRDCGIKDYGKIMPGHGGILDRFDSVITVAPLMYLILAHFPIVL